MEKHLQNQVLSLLRGAVTGEEISLSLPVDISAISEIARKHGLVGPIFYGMTAAGYPPAKSEPLYRMFAESIWMEENQTASLQHLYAAFEENRIDYMPLKGAVLRALYPHSHMRAMGDADILIRMEQYPQIQQILISQGFSPLQESDHELIWKNHALHLELHKRLMPSYHAAFYAYFGDGWQHAQKDNVKQNCFTLSDEDMFLYLFAHFAKHYRDGGVGIRQAMDLWIYLRAKPDLDMADIRQGLEHMHLLSFYENIRLMLAVWFEGAAPTEMTDFLTDRLFESGLFGKQEDRAVATGNLFSGGASAEAVPFRAGLRALFPALSVLQRRYPLLQRLPILLPLFWIVRWVEVLARHPDRIRKKQQRLSALTAESVQVYRDGLRYVGLEEQETV